MQVFPELCLSVVGSFPQHVRTRTLPLGFETSASMRLPPFRSGELFVPTRIMFQRMQLSKNDYGPSLSPHCRSFIATTACCPRLRPALLPFWKIMARVHRLPSAGFPRSDSRLPCMSGLGVLYTPSRQRKAPSQLLGWRGPQLRGGPLVPMP